MEGVVVEMAGKPSNKPKSETIILRVSKEMNDYLEELSKNMGLSKSAIVRQMVHWYRRHG